MKIFTEHNLRNMTDGEIASVISTYVDKTQIPESLKAEAMSRFTRLVMDVEVIKSQIEGFKTLIDSTP